MKKIKWLFVLLLCLFCLILISSVSASSNKMKILAVAEKDNGEFLGGVAELSVDIQEGKGRVFIDTYPITKLDTQMSARVAKELACDFLNRDCNKLDFFYTIRASSALVGGPSAGSAITLLTIATLDGIAVDQGATVTGTINSGGVIGPVGGLKAKVEAAANNNMKKVLIPMGTRMLKENNETVDLINFGDEKGVKVVEVANLYEGMKAFTGVFYERKTGDVSATGEYDELMKIISNNICNTTQDLIDKSINFEIDENDTDVQDRAFELYNRSLTAKAAQNHYSSASFCFGANVQLQYLEIVDKDYNEEEYDKLIIKIQKMIVKLEKAVDDEKINTIGELQTKMIVQERIADAKESLKLAVEDLNQTNITSYDTVASRLAYTIARFESAYFWSEFFKFPSNNLDLDEDALKNSCQAKLAEAEQRVLYLDLFFPGRFTQAENIVDDATSASMRGDYEYCLFQASRAKAQSDFYMTIMTANNDSIQVFLDNKKAAVEMSLFDQIEKGNFPILAYSYYEYGKSLTESDKMSAMLYYDYALELSNLDLYLGQQLENVALKEIKTYSGPLLLVALVIGLLAGFGIGVLYYKSNVVAIRVSGQGKKKSRKKAKSKKK